MALDQTGAPYEIVDMFRNPLGIADLRALLGTRSASDLFSWKSPQARIRGIAPGSRSDEELLALMAEEPRLIRRPVLRVGDELIIGADIASIKRLLAPSG